MAINRSGTIVGSAEIESGDFRAAAWTNGAVRALENNGGRSSHAQSINNLGQIVGWTSPSGALDTYATLWDGEHTIVLEPYSGAADINDHSQIVGSILSIDTGLPSAALWESSTAATILPTLGGNYGYAAAINNHGIIVGASSDADQAGSAVMWKGLVAYNLQAFAGRSSLTLTQAWDINDHGWIVGRAVDQSGIEHGFALIPVPEPSTALLGMIGAGLVLLLKNKRSS